METIEVRLFNLDGNGDVTKSFPSEVLAMDYLALDAPKCEGFVVWECIEGYPSARRHDLEQRVEDYEFPADEWLPA